MPTERQKEAKEAYDRLGSYTEVAKELGIKPPAARQLVKSYHQRDGWPLCRACQKVGLHYRYRREGLCAKCLAKRDSIPDIPGRIAELEEELRQLKGLLPPPSYNYKL